MKVKYTKETPRKIREYNEEDLTECVECGTFVSKTEKKRCTICTNESDK